MQTRGLGEAMEFDLMPHKTALLGLSAIGALVIAGSAHAQTAGLAGKAVATPPAMPATPATPALPATPPRAVAPAATTSGADVSATANAAAGFPIGTVVRDSAGVQIGTVMDPTEGMATEGRVAIRTGSGFITVPAASLRLDGGVAISNQTAADVGAGAKAGPQ